MEKFSQKQYEDIIRQMKIESARKGWLSVNINARELLNANEPGVSNLKNVCNAMQIEMGITKKGKSVKGAERSAELADPDSRLKRGVILNSSKAPGNVSGDLTIKYLLDGFVEEYGPKKKGPPNYRDEMKKAGTIAGDDSTSDHGRKHNDKLR